jgi:hypothetical protein
VTASGEGQGLRAHAGMPREPAAIRLRFTWDASGPGVITWRNEMAVGDGSWFLIGEYPMVPQ